MYFACLENGLVTTVAVENEEAIAEFAGDFPDAIYFEAEIFTRLPQNIEQYEVAWGHGWVRFKFMDWFGDGDTYTFKVDTAEKILLGLMEAIQKAKEAQ
jgi:hypothetical protein